MRRRQLVGALLSATLWVAASLSVPILLGAQEVKRADSHGVWGVFADGSGADRLCWVAAKAKLGALPLSPGAEPPPESVLVLFSSGKDELSLELGGLAPSDGHISLGGERFGLFSQDGWAWLSDDRLGTALKHLLVQHETAFIRLGSSGYSLSLDGFVPALRKAEGLCR